MGTLANRLNLFLTLIFFLFAAVLGLAVAVYTNTPNFSELNESVSYAIKNAKGDPSTRRVGPSAPGWVPLAQISNFIILATLASEDTTFFQHEGFDLHEIKQALKKDIEKKGFARGASTITQQLVKNLYLSSDKNLWRKAKELLWAFQLERALSKQEILTLYLNLVEWGPGIYGVGEASQIYFQKSPSQVSAKEAAFLAMLLPSPRKYHSYFTKKELTPWAQQRVDAILETMHRLNYINEPTLRQAKEQPLWAPALAIDQPTD